MTDEPGADRDMEQGSEQDPAQEAVRRLLAAARHDEPAPPDVVARLDAALAAEAARRPGPAHRDVDDSTGPAPDELAARRRRRRGSALLAAAAVVVVAGVGVSTLGDGPLAGGDSDSSGAGSGSDGAADLGSSVQQRSPSRESQESRESQDEDDPGLMSGSRTGRPTVRADRVAADAQRVLRSTAPLPAASARCGEAEPGDDVLRIRYDDDPGELVAGPEVDGTREVAIYSCAASEGSGPPLATLTVPAP